MTALIHCDGPDCPATRNPQIQDRAFGAPGWVSLDQYGIETMHFHNRACLAAWAASVGGS